MDRVKSPMVARLLAIAAWMGLAYGIFEGLESFLLSLLPQGLSWQNGNSVDALIYMPGLYLAAYLLFAILLLPLALLVRRDWWDIVLVFGLAGLSGYLAARNQGAVFSGVASAMLGLGIAAVSVRLYRRHLVRWRAGVVRTLPWLVLTAGVVIGGTYATKRLVESRRLSALPTPEPGRPSVLLLVLDTERADRLSSYGYHLPTTPRIDSFARGSVLFERAYAPSSWTLPSHASLFTGRLVHEHQAGIGDSRVLDSRFPTLAERLRDAGYATGGFVANIFWTARHTGLARGFLHYEDFYGTVGDALQRMTLVRDFPRVQNWLGMVDIRGRKRASHINADFLQWLDRIEGRPFFAFLNYMDLHAPYLPPESHEGRFGPVNPELMPQKLEIIAKDEEKLSPALLAHRSDRYDESLNYLDQHVGALLAELQRRGRLANTIVIVTSDHGEHFGEHGLLEHGKSLYVQETRVPLIIRAPGTTPSRVKQPVGLANLAATIASLAGLADAPFPGRSLLAASNEASDAPLPLLSELGGTGAARGPAKKGWFKSLIRDRWHYILRENGTEELFDLAADTGERTNLVGSVRGSEVAETMHNELERILRASPRNQAGRPSLASE